MENPQFTYYAFISYQRKDEKWAKWLQRKLENYKLPVANPKETSDKKSKYIRPVFRDKTDLTSGPLPDALKEALQQSRYLIVICSPHAVESLWVNEEIETFTKAGRSEFIIPFIVEGEPNAKEEAKECFPDALRAIPKEKEPLGVNISEGGKERAFIRTVAYMLRVKFDELWNRHERHRRKVRNLVIACLAFLALIALGAYDYTRTKVEYYADWVDCNGIAQGLFPLTDGQVSHRNNSYKFEYKRIPFGEQGFYSWRLKRVSIVNSKDKISSDYTPDHHEFFYPVQEYEYSDGYLSEIINKDVYDKVVMRYSVKDDNMRNVACLIDMGKKEKHQGSSFLVSSSTFADSTETYSKIKRFHYTRDTKGHIIRITYHANDAEELSESAISDNNNIYGKVFALDSQGRVIETKYINHDGEFISDKYGIASVIYKYDEDRLTQIDYVGMDGKLTYNNKKYAMRLSDYDEYGNLIYERYYGTDSLPCYDDHNVFKFNFKYDNEGFLVEAACYGTDEKLTYNKDCWAIRKFENDSRGNAIVISHFDVDQKPSYDENNISIYHINYNTKGQQTKLEFFNKDNKPCVSKSQGVHIQCMEYNKDGNIAKQSFFDKNGNPTESPTTGWAYAILDYDSYSNLVSLSFYGKDGNPIIQKEGYHQECRNYDNKGNLTSATYFDEKGDSCYNKNGWSSLRRQYDVYGNIAEESYLGTNNEPVYIGQSTKIKIYHTSNGLRKEMRCYDANDSLSLNDLWYAIEKYEYDNNGNPIRISFYDRDSIPCYIKNGVYSAVEKEYKGNDCIEERYFDKNMNLHENAFNYAIIKMKYDNQHRVIEHSYYDAQGSPCVNVDLFHSQHTVYNSKGQISSIQYFDRHRRPCNLRNGSSKIVYKYDNRGLCIEEAFYDKNGKLRKGKFASKKKYDYDEYGRLVKECNYDENDNPSWASMIESGPETCQIEYEYDEWGNISKTIHRDTKGELTVLSGYAIKECTYDEVGRPKSIKYYDEKRDYIGGNAYYPIEKYTYDKDYMKVSFYYNDSTLVTNVNFFYERGLPVRTIYTDSHDKPWVKQIMTIYDNNPFAICTNEYDFRGNVIKRAFYDENGQLFESSTNYAYEIFEYDNRGYITSVKHYNCKGELSNASPAGWAIGLQRNDIYGNLVEQSYYDNNNKLAITPWGWYKRSWEFDDMGRCTYQAFFFCNGTSNGVRIAYKDDGTEQIDRMVNGVWESNVQKAEKPELAEKDRQIIIAEVQNYGQMYEKGFRGTYVILEWNEWNCMGDIDGFQEAMFRSKGHKKHLVLLRVEDAYKSDLNIASVEDVIEYTFSEDALMARIMDHISKDGNIRNSVISKYKEWKGKKQK